VTVSVHTFGPFRFDADQMLLLRDAVPVALGSRAAAILASLLMSGGRVVGKDELMAAAWPDAVVEESNLSVQISKLRRTIGEERIRTIERIGYQFVTGSAAAVGSAPQRPQLNVSVQAASTEVEGQLVQYTGGAVISALVAFGTLELIDGAGSAHYRLDLRLGAIQGGLQIAVQLGSTEGGIFWAEIFNCPSGNRRRWLEGIADRISAMVASRLSRLSVYEARWTQSASSAQQLLVRARRLARRLTPAANASAIALLDQALLLEPDNVPILSVACEARYHRIAMGWRLLGRDDLNRCGELADLGLRQPDADPAATAVFGGCIYRAGDFDRGLDVMNRSVDRNPNGLTALLFTGTSTMHWGDVDKAEAMFRRALKLDPTNPDLVFVMGGLARIRMMRRQYDQAIAWARRAIAVDVNYGAAHWSLIAASALLGERDDAARHLNRFRQLQPEASLEGIRVGQPARPDRMTSTLEGLELAGLQ
jgi:DNA-binding winged helix-turn-helix (wHTH) protein